MRAHPADDDLVADPLRPDVRVHLETCIRCECKRDDLRDALFEPEPMTLEDRFHISGPLPRTGRFEAVDAMDLERGVRVCLKRVEGIDDLASIAATLDGASPHVEPFEALPDGRIARRLIVGRDGSAIDGAPRAVQLHWLAQTVVALAGLHRCGLAHGAVHERNLRIDPTRVLKLVDGGLGGEPADDWIQLGHLFEQAPLPELSSRLVSGERMSAEQILEEVVLAQCALSNYLGRYTRMGALGSGGMGEVLRVRDPSLDRTVALKSMLPDLADSTSARTRFEAEARITAQLEHPGVIPVHEMGELPDGSPYFTMKQVAGQTFAVVLRAGAPEWTLPRLIDVLIRVAQTVAYAHSRGVVHRDLKPANVMVGDFGEVLVLDWGLAKVEGSSGISEQTSAEGTSTSGVGTPGYMSPEQRSGQGAIRPQSDVYSLGVVLREILGDDATEPELSAIAHRATDDRPDQRYADAAQLADELIRWRDGQLVHAYDYSATELLVRRVRPYAAPLAVGAVAFAVLFSFAAVGSTRLANTQRVARESSAQSLVERAHLALNAGDRMLAEVYAAEALALAERPEARGILAKVGRSPYPRVVRTEDTAAEAPSDDLVGEAHVGGKHVLATRERMWVAEDPTVELAVFSAPIHHVVPCGPDRVLVHTLADVMQLWTPDGDHTVLSVDVRAPGAVVCDPEGKRAAFAQGSSIQLWDLEPSVQIGNLTGHDGGVVALDWHDDLVASASTDQSVRVWDVQTPRQGSELYRLNLDAPELVDLDDHGLETRDDQGTRRWSLPGEQQVSWFDVMVGLRRVDWLDGDRLALIDRMGVWRRVDARTGTDQVSFPLRGIHPRTIATNRDGERIYVGLESGEVAALDAEGSTEWRIDTHPSAISAVAWSPSQHRLATASTDGSIAVLDSDGAPVHETNAQGDPAASMAYSADGSTLLVVRESGLLETYATDGAASSLASDVRIGAVSGDGTTWAAQRAGGSFVIEARSSASSSALPEVTAMAVSPDGRWVATAADRLVQIWSVADGREVARLVEHARGAVSLAFSPDGEALATAGRDGIVVLWDMKPVYTDPEDLLHDVYARYGIQHVGAM